MKTRTKHKHAFEIKAFADGWEIIHSNKPFKNWDIVTDPIWDEETIYVVNDALVEFRKSEKMGKQVQGMTSAGWINIRINEYNPREKSDTNRFRIKPSKPDFSILNEEDVFYIKTWEYSFLLRWDCNTKDEIKHFNCVNIENTDCQYNRGFFQKSGVECLRKATPKETALFYKHFPELEPPKVGDWGWFWDYEKMQTRISKLCAIHHHNVGTYQDLKAVCYRHFKKIDTSKSLDEIIKEFGL